MLDVVAMVAETPRCPYCGTSFQRSTMRGGRSTSATLDRVLPDSGYTLGNIVVACHLCNSLKGSHTPATLRAFAERIEDVMRGTHGQDKRSE